MIRRHSDVSCDMHYVFVCIFYVFTYVFYVFVYVLYVFVYVCVCVCVCFCMCFVDLEKSFDSVPRKVLEWPLRKNEVPEVLVRSVMSLYEGAKTSVRVDSELSEEFEVKVGMDQGSVLSLFLFAVVVDVVIELAREGVLSELLYDVFQMTGDVEGLRSKFLKLNVAYESKGLKVKLGKTKVMFIGDIGKDSSYISKVLPCGDCGLRVNAM